MHIIIIIFLVDIFFSITLRKKKLSKCVSQNGSLWKVKYESGIRIYLSSMHLKIQSPCGTLLGILTDLCDFRKNNVIPQK